MPGIDIIAHRGASFDAPENTLAAFRLALESGADGIEGDFRLTGDGHLVCIHDATTGRTADANLTVSTAKLDQLRLLDAGSWKGAKWAGERLPTIHEVLALLPPEKKIFIELKGGPDTVAPLRAALSETGLTPEQATVLAFDSKVVATARSLMPRVKALWLVDCRREALSGGWSPPFGQLLRTLQKTGAAGLSLKARRSIDIMFVTRLRAQGMEFHVWTVDSPRSALRFFRLGADSITTNRPRELKGWLAEYVRGARLSP